MLNAGSLATSAAEQAGTQIGDLDAQVLTAAGFRMRQQEIAAGAGMDVKATGTMNVKGATVNIN